MVLNILRKKYRKDFIGIRASNKGDKCGLSAAARRKQRVSLSERELEEAMRAQPRPLQVAAVQSGFRGSEANQTWSWEGLGCL